MSEENAPTDPVIKACVDLVGRAGARKFEIGFVRDDVPSHLAGWYAYAMYRGARITVEEQVSPQAAAMAMARRMLRGATCRCGRPVTLVGKAGDCSWRLADDRWEPGCPAPSMTVPPGAHGDWAAMSAALPKPPPPTRADRIRRHGVGQVLDGDTGGDASWLD